MSATTDFVCGFLRAQRGNSCHDDAFLYRHYQKVIDLDCKEIDRWQQFHIVQESGHCQRRLSYSFPSQEDEGPDTVAFSVGIGFAFRRFGTIRLA